MRTNKRSTLLVLAFLVFASACTPAEIALYFDSTEPTRDVLSAVQLSNLRDCESTDDYGAVSPSGLYRGAYQFDRATWNDVADRHFPWLTGRDPATVEPWWQDAMTRALWSERGSRPWPVCGHMV